MTTGNIIGIPYVTILVFDCDEYLVYSTSWLTQVPNRKDHGTIVGTNRAKAAGEVLEVGRHKGYISPGSVLGHHQCFGCVALYLVCYYLVAFPSPDDRVPVTLQFASLIELTVK